MTTQQMAQAWVRDVVLNRRTRIDGRGPLVTFSEHNLQCHLHGCPEDDVALLLISLLLDIDPVLEVRAQ